MTNSTYNAHTTPLFIAHNILPYEQLIHQSQLTFMHSIEYNYAPLSFTNTWQKNINREPELNLCNLNDYHILHPRTETFKKSTLHALPAARNNLSPNIKLQQNKTTFKWAL